VTVVVEAPFKSGAINTATQALEMGRVVAAVPGPIDDPRSAGANLLIRDGAQVITCEADMLALLGLSTNDEVSLTAAPGTGSGAVANLGQEDQALLRSLSSSFTPVHEIAFQSGMSVRQVSDSLLRLEIAGLIEAGNGGYRRRG
jgi:DNA processing protein